MNRRQLLQQSAALSVAAGFPAAALALPMLDPFAPSPGPWRTYEITTKIELVSAKGAAQAWIPIPAIAQPNWIRPGQSKWKTNASTVAIHRDPGWSAPMVYAQWAASSAIPSLEIVGRVATRDRAVDLKKPGSVADLSPADRARYTSPTTLIPTDGIVKSTADKITASTDSDLAKARAIYEWIVDNTFRNPKTPGCGLGNIQTMLVTGDLGGKCADINALYVGLARATGLPARDLYGIRVGPSDFGYKSLGANTPDVTHAQHCRAEVFLTGFGWVPVDPADVRKVVLEEPPGHLALDNALVTDARTTLFGAWESNWVAYNDGHDVRLPGSSHRELGFLMYPHAEAGGERLDCLAADDFRYTITAHEITG
jgi:transglutaminase-like putative cysteine protease